MVGDEAVHVECGADVYHRQEGVRSALASLMTKQASPTCELKSAVECSRAGRAMGGLLSLEHMAQHGPRAAAAISAWHPAKRSDLARSALLGCPKCWRNLLGIAKASEEHLALCPARTGWREVPSRAGPPPACTTLRRGCASRRGTSPGGARLDVLLEKVLHDPAIVEVRGPSEADSVPLRASWHLNRRRACVPSDEYYIPSSDSPPLGSIKSSMYTSIIYAPRLG